MIKPLSKKIHAEAIKLGITSIHLRFQGGSDEGYLDIEVEPLGWNESRDIREKIEEWAWDAYDYSGAGDGSDYGDEITYDLAKNEVSHTEWCMTRTEQNYRPEILAIDEEGGE
jgi:hypothetical protein